MIYVVLFFLAFSLLLYVLLAGADFGAGIIELFSSKENQDITKKTVYRVMGPVWEANHIWIIILIVILWIAFPNYYYIIVTSLHIPLTLMLLGITLRGVTFVFRHYDAYKDKSQIVYDSMFKISSLVTPIFIGLTFGATISGKIVLVDEVQNLNFIEAYVSPWLNIFSILIGCFFAALCAFMAGVLLIGEAESTAKKIYIKKASIAIITVVILGLITLAYGYFTNIGFATNFINSRFSWTCVILSALILLPLWKSVRSGRRIFSRLFAGVQVVLILVAAIIPSFPNLIYTQDSFVSIYHKIAVDSVISSLGITLIIGGLVILPGLFHLFKSFKMIKILDL